MRDLDYQLKQLCQRNRDGSFATRAVPTATLRVLYGFFVIEHGRRHVLHFNATFDATAAWVTQELREAFPYDTASAYLIFDRDSIRSAHVVRFVKAIDTDPRCMAYRSPWQNPVAARWIGSCRRELLEHVVVFDERHLIRLMRLYIRYYEEDRCRLGLDKDAPDSRATTPPPSSTAQILALLRVGGLHHRCG